jgi:hypothetical protein
MRHFLTLYARQASFPGFENSTGKHGGTKKQLFSPLLFLHLTVYITYLLFPAQSFKKITVTT